MHRTGLLVKSRALAEDMVAVVQARRRVHKQRAEPFLALDEWALMEILADEMGKIEQEKASAATLPLSDASCTMLNAVMPSGPMLPMGRLGTAEEVADVIVFIASPRAHWINGRNIPVDGLEQPHAPLDRRPN
jgi:hypothetical protein